MILKFFSNWNDSMILSWDHQWKGHERPLERLCGKRASLMDLWWKSGLLLPHCLIHIPQSCQFLGHLLPEIIPKSQILLRTESTSQESETTQPCFQYPFSSFAPFSQDLQMEPPDFSSLWNHHGREEIQECCPPVPISAVIPCAKLFPN